MQTVQQFLVEGFDKNCTYICTDSTDAIIVDPAGDLSAVHRFLETAPVTVSAIWLTHTHPDHTDGLDEILARYGSLPIYVHTLGQRAVTAYDSTHPIQDQDILQVGEQQWTVWHTPGHSPDSVCFYTPKVSETGSPALLSGDTLFVQGCGRTTPTDAPLLWKSLQRIAELPDQTIIYPGHNYGPRPTSTLEHERTHNPYLLAKDQEAFYTVRFPNE